MKRQRGNRPFLVLVALLVVLGLGGGGSRYDILSLIYLRPVAAVALGIGLYSLTRPQVRAHRYVFAMLLFPLALIIIHLVPLPPALWASLPGRESIAVAAELAGIEQPWRPLAMVPWRGANVLFAMLVPLAVLVLAAQVDDKRQWRFLVFLIGLGVASALLALLQVIGPSQGPLYLYRITNEGGAVGLFANRNHAALLLAMVLPLCAAYAAGSLPTIKQSRRRHLIAFACVALVIPLILIARSRAGIIASCVGFVAVALFYRQPQIDRRPRRTRRRLHYLVLPTAAVVAIFTTVALAAGRATSLGKLAMAEGIDSTRQTAWTITVDAIQVFMPFGSGFGSFVETFQMFETRDDLMPQYINHAHNDYLELMLVAGVPGLILLAAALWFLTSSAWAIFFRAVAGEHRDTLLMGRLGLVLLVQLALGSLVDYPLRTPIMSAIAVLAAVWVVRARNLVQAPESGRS